MIRHSAGTYTDRIDQLKKEMRTAGITAYYVPCGDFHMSEYISDHFKCREFLSGFDGSNGEMIITAGEALLWTDGRYFLQAEEQLQGTGIKLMKMGEPGVPKISEFLKNELKEGDVIGFDGRCVSGGFYDRLLEALEGLDVSFVTDIDLVGKIWADRPSLPSGKAWMLDDKYTGMNVPRKLAKVREKLAEDDLEVLMISSLDDIAWLMNFRGSDIDYNPVTLSYAVITADDAVLYMSPDKSADICGVLENYGIRIRDYEDIFEDVKSLTDGKRVSYDPERTNLRLISSIPESAKITKKWSPTMMLKGVKNDIECDNERSAHVSDGVAVTKIIRYIKSLRDTKELECGKVTELDIAEKLLGFRKEAEDFIEESFAPIIAAGAHGAIIHYEPTEETNAALTPDSIVLMDTGGQYLKGTTDITRSVLLGRATDKMKTLYTAVLKGNLALSSVVFRKGTAGRSLDLLARKPLWDLGYDYRHGTGHGVGYLLNVHEGPQNISTSVSSKGDTPFETGMITSDEPGVYLEGEFGIRTENMILCVPRNTNEYGDFYGFDVLTLVPYDRDLIDKKMLTEEEIRLVDEYHERVYGELSPYLDEDEKKWLRGVTLPL
ncbi:MAG: aminopeptidase P family protein [Lachnospiraceae bacterium]|nr:aminopeptidase P family protein [Lachnospiraceae bacterium]